MYQYVWFNYYKGRYVNVVRIEEINKIEAQICDEDGDWYKVKIAELRRWRHDKPPSEENVIVSIRDESGDTPYNYTSVGWWFNGLWVVDNALCSYVIAWMELPEPLT